MQSTAKISKKGQVTIPKHIRDILDTDIVEFELTEENVVIKPVRSVSGSLGKYSKKYVTVDKVREKVWRGIADERAGKKTT